MSLSYGSRHGKKIEWIICHYPAAPGCNASWCKKYYDKTNVSVSAHYAVSSNETVSIVPCAFAAWHCATKGSGIKTYCAANNYNSIGIDLMDNKICRKTLSVKDTDWYIPEATLDRASYLIAYLMRQYNIDIDHVIRHYDVTLKWCMPLDTTELLTPNGWTPLGEIKTGEQVMTVSVPELAGKFDSVLSVVTPYESEVIKNHGLELTHEHRVWSKPNCLHGTWGERLWGEIVNTDQRKTHQIPTFCSFGDGIELTDNELRLLVWVQGDGYFYRNNGIEFHLSKERKIKRIVELLEQFEIHPMMHWCQNGSVHIRVRNQKIRDFLNDNLDKKQFKYDLLNMSKEQFRVFWEEILHVDGCKAGNLYTSLSTQSLDVVSALCATHGVRQNRTKIGGVSNDKIYDTIAMCSSNYTVGWQSKEEGRSTLVSCVTVPSGYILIRQKGRTYVVGNCPRPLVGDDINEYYGISGNERWAQFKQQIQEKLK